MAKPGNPNKIITEHHNIPRSRGGSNNEINLSSIIHEKHSLYHEFAQNLMPCELTRWIILHWFLKKRSFNMNPKTLTKIFRSTATRNWRNLYDKNTVVAQLDQNAIRNAQSSAMHAIRLLQYELELTKKTIENTGQPETLTEDQNDFINKCSSLFHSCNSKIILSRLYSEQSSVDKYRWANALKSDTRDKIAQLIKNSHYQEINKKNKGSIKNLLVEHRDRLEKLIKKWKKEILTPDDLIKMLFTQHGYSLKQLSNEIKKEPVTE